MRRIWLVALREYIENVKTKTFLIGIFLTPLMMAAAIAIPKLAERTGPKEVTLAFVDATGIVREGVRKRVGEHNGRIAVRPRYKLEEVSATEDEIESVKQTLASRTREKELFGFFVLSGDVVGGKGRFEYHTSNPAEDRVPRQFRGFVEDTVKLARMEREGLDPTVVEEIQRPVPLEEFDVTKKAGEQQGSREGTFVTAFVFTILLFMGIFGYAQWLLTTLIEEKSNRIVEVVLSSVSPFQLMTGKILGMGLVSLTLLSLWSGAGYLGAATQDWTRFVPIQNLAFFLVYFVLGFFLYASLFSAIGAACNTLKEAQNMQGPLTIVLIVPMFLLVPITKDPEGTIAVVMSWFPFFTPFVMMNRLAASPSPEGWEIAGTIAWLAISVVIVMWAAGRVFRVGILMYGKPPRPGELFRWMRTK